MLFCAKFLCRLHFNSRQKYVGIGAEDRKETLYPIDSLDDIYALVDELLAVAARYL